MTKSPPSFMTWPMVSSGFLAYQLPSLRIRLKPWCNLPSVLELPSTALRNCYPLLRACLQVP